MTDEHQLHSKSPKKANGRRTLAPVSVSLSRCRKIPTWKRIMPMIPSQCTCSNSARLSLFHELRGTIGAERRETIERRLIESQLPLVASIAEKDVASGIPVLDLIQEGNLGLMKSIRSFAEMPAGDFLTFAATCIEDAITELYRKSK